MTGKRIRYQFDCLMWVTTDTIQTNGESHQNRQTTTSLDTHTVRLMVSGLNPPTMPRRETSRSSRRRLVSGGDKVLLRLRNVQRHNSSEVSSDQHCVHEWSRWTTSLANERMVTQQHQCLEQSTMCTYVHVVQALTKFCRGLGFERFCLQCDPEHTPKKQGPSCALHDARHESAKESADELIGSTHYCKESRAQMCVTLNACTRQKIPFHHTAVCFAVRHDG